MTLRLLLSLLLLSSCLNPSQVRDKNKVINSMADSLARKFPNLNQLSPRELNKAPEDQFIIIDVRSDKERNVSRIKGSISIDQFEKLNKEQKLKKHLVFYCTIGQRSSTYATKLLQSGYTGKVSNLKGSILAWTQANLPLEDLNNSPTKKVHVYSEAWNLLPKDFEAVWN